MRTNDPASIDQLAFLIPGLSMHSQEFSMLHGVNVLDNPEMDGTAGSDPYTLEDVADLHVRTIEAFCHKKNPRQLKLIGMSMGGMVLSIVASKLRAQLPGNTRFLFLVTSPNSADVPTIPDDLLSSWLTIRPGDVDSFRQILTPFFSGSFVNENMCDVEKYISYRSTGKNNQSGKAFFRQIDAVRSFDGKAYFSSLNPNECQFIGGGSDRILGPEHNKELVNLIPSSIHIEVPDLGHMINIERPDLISKFIEEGE